MKKLKYRLIKAIATLLGCEYIIDYEEYYEVVPRNIRPYKGKLPDGLLKFNDPLHDKLGYSEWYEKHGRGAYLNKLKDIGFGRPEKPFTHYEAPREDKKK